VVALELEVAGGFAFAEAGLVAMDDAAKEAAAAGCFPMGLAAGLAGGGAVSGSKSRTSSLYGTGAGATSSV
jgi:hypothetical protein